jgi:hypothetical protein
VPAQRGGSQLAVRQRRLEHHDHALRLPASVDHRGRLGARAGASRVAACAPEPSGRKPPEPTVQPLPVRPVQQAVAYRDNNRDDEPSSPSMTREPVPIVIQRGVQHLPWRRRPVQPLLEPRGADPQHPAGQRVRHPVLGPLVSDEARHAHFVASFTHRTTDRLRDITLHPQLGVLGTQLLELGLIVHRQALGLAAGGPVLVDPVAQRAGVDPQVPRDDRDRLLGLTDDPDSPLTELRVELPSDLWPDFRRSEAHDGGPRGICAGQRLVAALKTQIL